MAVKRGDEIKMRWVDNDSYFGPDRRQHGGGLRLTERRRNDCAATPPPLSTALRQLRLRVLDAQGPGVSAFADRVQGTAVLAQLQHEPEVAFELNTLSMTLNSAWLNDARANIYKTLDRAHALMRAA
jgi:hypothetical protein